MNDPENSSSMDSQEEIARRLRVKERRHYTEDCLQDEEIEGKRMFSVEEKLASDKFGFYFVKDMKGDDFGFKWLQKHGFEQPIMFKEKSGLGMRMPSKNFSVNDVRQCVGSRRMLDVMDVTTQKDIEMNMKDWCRYFENTNRDKLLNVISLEFSHTRLENYVESPLVVRQVDWVDWVWPRHLKESQTDGTNAIEEMKYPKVQKYCLMSVKGCYTDFHIDFGGTSVWYHILRGQKVFWLIPPTEKNLHLYEQWVLSGKQGDVFFGDTVEKCARVHLYEGYTFFIPTGWIHAVYTPEDTLVFGGNFLHSFGIEKQLRIADIEDATHVPLKFRYPFYIEMLWCVLQRYVHCLMGKNHMICNEDGEPVKANESPPTAFKPNIKSDDLVVTPPDSPSCPANVENKAENGYLDPQERLLSPLSTKPLIPKIPPEKYSNLMNGTRTSNLGYEINVNFNSPCKQPPKPLNGTVYPHNATDVNKHQIMNGEHQGKFHVHLTTYELNGLKTIVRWLQRLPSNKRNVPDLIRDPEALLLDAKQLIQEHKNDDPELAVTGNPVLFWSESKKPKSKPKSNVPSTPKNSKSGSKSGSGSNNARRRRTRCKKCEACLRADCGECHFCKDMKKFGGPGRMKQSCISRQCMAPMLPHTACCMICGRDGWEKNSSPPEHESSSLMECSQCWEIVHPGCLKEKFPDLPPDGMLNDDLPNSWECPKCCRDGKPDQIKPRQMKSGRQKGTEGKHMIPPPPPSSLPLPPPPPPAPLPIGAGSGPVPPNFVPPMNLAELPEESLPIELAVPPTIGIGGVKREFSHLEEPHGMMEKMEDTSNMTDSKKIKLEEHTTKAEPSDHGSSDSSDDQEGRGGDISDSSSPILQNTSPKRPPSTTSNEREEEESSSSSSPAKLQNENPDVIRQRKAEIKGHTPSLHVRSCARYPLMVKSLNRNDQSRPVSSKLPSKSEASLKLDLRARSTRMAVGMSPRRHGETARERLFRNLKDLKKNSELMQHGLLRVKSRMSSDSAGNSLSRKEAMSGSKEMPRCEVKVEKVDSDSSQRKSKHGIMMSSSEDSGEEGRRQPLVADNNSKSGKGSDDKHNPHQSKRLKINLRDRSHLRKPKFVVRPAPLPEDIEEKKPRAPLTRSCNLALEKDVIFPVLTYLSPADLFNCQLVCKLWDRWCVDPALWTHIDLSRRKMTANILMGLVRRQPICLNLSWTNISRRQLSWLIVRLPQLKDLILGGCSASAVSALCTCNCPLLRTLDLSWVEGLTDSFVRDLLSPPLDSRPGVMETKTRLRQLIDVRLSGADISDVSVRLLAHHLPLLSRLDLSHCHKVTDMGIAVLGAAKSARLVALDVSSCSNITDTSLEALKRCTNLSSLDMRDCPQVNDAACQKFVNQNRQFLVLKAEKLIERDY